ncbi:hypothetical protein [Inquilinus sp.]|uniref:hypothetical protein n=1 Tax=Inquilinus sp. TaxID=1932117 RepID=UPI0037841BB3
MAARSSRSSRRLPARPLARSSPRERVHLCRTISGRQLTHGGLVDLFDRRFSGDDTAERHKPALEAYAEVTKTLGAQPAEMCRMACHS